MQLLKAFIPPFLFGFFGCLALLALSKYAVPMEYDSYMPQSVQTWLALDGKIGFDLFLRPLISGLACGFAYGIYEYIRQRSSEQKNNDSAESA